MILTPLVSAVQIDWTESASTDGVRGTQILYSEISGLDTNLHLIDEVPRGTSSYIKGLSGTGAQWSYSFSRSARFSMLCRLRATTYSARIARRTAFTR